MSLMPTNYVPYHIHSMLSNGTTNIDSITNFRDYIKKAKELKMKALGISEHGNIFEWLHKKEAIEAAGMKYLHGVEIYLTEDNQENSLWYEAIDLLSSEVLGHEVKFKFRKHWQREDGGWLAIAEEHHLKEFIGKTLLYDPSDVKEDWMKNRDNYHCILIAKNYEGVKEINKLTSKSYSKSDYHYYYAPRVSFDELFSTTDNIIITTACLGGVLNNGNQSIKEKFINFLRFNKHRCFLEIQHHNCQEQIEYNQFLYQMSKATGVPLIAGTDTHALNDEHMDGRAMFQKSKSVRFDNEDAWDLSFKSTQELIAAYKIQNSLPMEVVYESIENTNRMAEMVETFSLDYSAKYPKLYSNSEEVFKEKINQGVVSRNIISSPRYQEYIDRIEYELETYKHNNAIDFMLLEEDYKSEMRRKNIKFGYSRGSVSGSLIAYLLGITEIDSVKLNLNFERFMNKERVSLADIDTDWFSEDRDTVKDYLYNKKGLYCCDIVTFNTIALKGAIRDICRGMFNYNMDNLPLDIKKKIQKHYKEIKGHDSRDTDVRFSKQLEKEIEKNYIQNAIYKEVPYDYIKFAEQLIELAENSETKAREKYPRVFHYVDLVNGCVVSVGNHPAACVVSPVPVDEWFGTFTTAGDKYPISVLNMKEIDSLNFVKLDILGLDNIGLIYKTCELAGIPFLTPDNTPADDLDVWNSIREDTTMIFQWESNSATSYLKQLFSDSTINRIKKKNKNFSYIDLLSIGNGAIRPAGESYRDTLAQGIYRDNGHKALNDLLAPTLGYLVYQEQVIEFLHLFCGYTMGEADMVRRGFAKKTGTDKFIPKIKEGFQKAMLEKYAVSESESDKLIVNFIKVIEDASDYLFSKNHSDPYSWIGYICGYLRYYYPLEFITSALNIFEDKEDKSLAIISYAKKNKIKISSIKFRHSTAQYNFDKDSNQIYKGISSIKYLNAKVADEIYDLKDNQYDSFMALLFDLITKTSINSRQLKILIELDFFSEFGNSNTLMAQYQLYDNFEGKKQIKKDELDKMGISLEIGRAHAGKETPKMFSDINLKSFLLDATKFIYKPAKSLSEQLQTQIELLGYISVVDKKYSGIACVLSVDTKYSPKLKLYSLKNGTTLECKIKKTTFNKNRLEVGDIIKVVSTSNKPKVKKNNNGDWEDIPGTNELWINSYYKIDNI